MSWSVLLQPRARREIATAAARYEREREGLGQRFLEELSLVRTRIAESPEQFQRWPDDASFRRAVVNVFPYVVFYRVDDTSHTIVIVAVAHTSREPGYWK